MSSHAKIPWRITEPSEKKTREIVAVDGSTVAKLTKLDIENAELIVAAVNAYVKEKENEKILTSSSFD